MFPELHTWAAYRDLWRRAAPWEPALRAICEREHLEPAAFRRVLDDGTHIVWTDRGALAIKLHCPFFPDSEVEQHVTRFMSGRLPVSIPELVATGEVGGWPYTVTTWVPGVGLDEAWKTLDFRQRLRIAHQLGDLVRAWHEASKTGIPIADSGWNECIDSRVAATESLQRASGLEERLIRQVPGFLEPYIEEFRSPSKPVLLHCDFKREHIRVEQQGGEWNVCGLIDFGDAMVGHHEYDFIDSTLSLIPPDGSVLGSFFEGYGERRKYASRRGRSRLLAWVLVHNDTGVTAFRGRGSWPALVRSLEDLASELWPIA